MVLALNKATTAFGSELDIFFFPQFKHLLVISVLHFKHAHYLEYTVHVVHHNAEITSLGG